MPRYDQAFNFLEQQNALSSLWASPWLNSGAEALLDAQADVLTSLRASIGEWIDRRHAAIHDTKRLISRLQQGHELDNVLHAYQEWAERALERMATDLAAFYSA